MFANFFNLLTRKPSAHYENAFVHEVHVARKRPRNLRTERLLVYMWILIAAKSAFIWWACSHYPIPFGAMWVIGPTVIFGILCTGVYWSHR